MEEPQKRRIQKPIGLYILTICIFLRFGVFQLISDFNSIRETENATPFLIAFILISRNVFVAGAAVLAYLGENWGRISLLTIVSLNVLWTLFNVITFVSYIENNQNLTPILFDLLNPIFWLIVCWWYLNTKIVVEYYKQND
jgi:hypothetical protein